VSRDTGRSHGPTQQPAGEPPHEPAPELVAAGYAWEAADGGILHDSLNLADLAHALELAQRGVIPPELFESPSTVVDYDPARGEVCQAREHHLAGRIGDCAGWLRAGRTRREAVRTAFRILLRRCLLDLVDAAAELAGALARRATQSQDAVMPDYTYLQPAQPTTFGHYLLSFADPVLREADRLLAEFGQVNAGPGGSGAANGSRLLDDRDRTAHLLGFDRAIEHTRDAMWQVDPFLHSLTAATGLLLTQDKLAEDLEIFASAEFGFLDLADGFSRPSMLMPQKRNPYALTVIRGSTGIVIGRLTGQLALSKSPSARSDNLIYMYGEVPRALDLAERVTRLTAGVIDTLILHPARMRTALHGVHTHAADLAELLMQHTGADYRTAHRVVRHLIQDAETSYGTLDIDSNLLAQTSQRLLGQAWRLDPAELAGVLDPDRIVASRTALGGAAPAPMAAMLDRVDDQAAGLRSEVTARRSALTGTEQAVVTAARTLAEPDR
jgi:argininosuccinate lyase